ncbi:MAG TPA: alpha/beta hydrolase [Dehalococcoidia bacterium]|nr:alpha/beta hydrolase [Dehalococcoidia bacterium]
MRSHAIIVNGGVRLNVMEAGNSEGRPILFIHGWSQSSLCWAKQFESDLADRFHLLAMDLRGHGDSDKPETGYEESRAWADDVARVLGHFSLKGAVLAGWSYGGLVINDYIRAHGQERIAGVCYVGAATDLGIQTPYKFLGPAWNGLLPTSESVSGTVFANDAEELARTMRQFLRGCFAQPLLACDEMMMLGFNLQCPSRVRAALFNRTLHNDDVLTELTLPVLVLHGDADQVVDIGTAQHISSRVKGSSMKVIEGAGHGTFWDQPERFNNEVIQFACALT